MTSAEMQRRRKAAKARQATQAQQTKPVKGTRRTHQTSSSAGRKRNDGHSKRNAAGTRRPADQRKYERFYYQYDYILLFFTILIALFGVLMIYSSSSYTSASMYKGNPYHFVVQQLLGLSVGIVFMLVTSNLDYQNYIVKLPVIRVNLIQILYFVCLVLQSVVLIPGIGVAHNGARRWLRIGIEFQPSEITKIAVILFVAYAIYRSRSSLDRFPGFAKIMLYVGPLIFLIALQNLSTAIIVTGVCVGMCFIASRKNGYFLLCGAGLAVLGFLYIMLGSGFRQARLEAWLNVENSDTGYQILQGLYAIASGGLFGSGLGQSMQKLGYIPEAYNDMIFAIICEELGLVGAVVVIGLFVVLLWRILVIACNAPDLLGSMICIGVMLHIALQVILNIAVVTNTIPSTGVPLPFISYGGTASMIMMAEMGLVLGVSGQVKIKY